MKLLSATSLNPRPFEQRVTEMKSLAQSLDPRDVVESGEFLGAGLMGGCYRLSQDGQTFIVKQMGHPESITGQFNSHTKTELLVKSAKQVAVQNALGMAGFPTPASAVLESDPDWLVMEDVPGLAAQELTSEEKNEVGEKMPSLREELEPTISATLGQLSEQYPEQANLFKLHIDVDLGNAKFARGPEGVLVCGIYDPVV